MNHPGLPRGAISSRSRNSLNLFCLIASLLAVALIAQACSPIIRQVSTPTGTSQFTRPAKTEISAGTDTPIAPPTIAAVVTQAPSLTPEASQAIAFTPTPEASATSTQAPLVFAAIGDYGGAGSGEKAVADLVKSWQPEFIITLGDNNYPSGAADQIDAAVGQFFHDYIDPYAGNYGAGADANRFFPSLGNHDIMTEGGTPYFDYFTLPGNERYYDFTWGPVHLFALNDLETEPDGVGVSSVQAAWLKQALADSTSPWNVVYMHYPPYSSGTHGSTTWARWPYAQWGADAVLAGHDHTYERLEEDGIPYFVNGLGGYSRYDFTNIEISSLVRYNAEFGAMRIEASTSQLQFQFINIDRMVIDALDLRK